MKKTRNGMRVTGFFLTMVMLVALLGAFSLTASAEAAEDISVTIDTGASITLKDTDGDGAYEISNADELYAFAAAVNGGSYSINGELTANIVVNENVLNEDGTLNGDGSNFRVWIPIAYSYDYGGGYEHLFFAGTFNGNGKAVSGLYFSNSMQSYVGLFGQISGYATVKNVGVIDSYFYGNLSVGGVVGYIATTASTVMNSYNTSTISGTDMAIGGIAGWNAGGYVTNCYNTGTVNGTSYVGGVVGYSGDSFIINSYNTGTVNGTSYVGGVVGDRFWSDITNCYYLVGTANGGINGADVKGEAEVKDDTWFADYTICMVLDIEHKWENGSCTVCGIDCTHESYTNGFCNDCGQEFFAFDGVLYEVLDEVTYKGLELYGSDVPTTLCYKAGEGYIIAKMEKHDAQIILYNATIDVSERSDINAIYTFIQNIEYIVYGTSNIYGNGNHAFFSSGSDTETSEITMTVIDDGILNIYGTYTGNNLIINSGTVNVYDTAEYNSTKLAVDLRRKLKVNEGATFNVVCGNETSNFSIGIMAQEGIENNGTLNATYLTGVDNDNKMIYNFVISGDVVLYNDLYNLFKGEEIPDGMIVEFNIIILDGAKVTVPEGVMLDLDSMTKVDVQGKIIVEGTLICTHEGGEATCTEDAICDVCKTSYIEAFGHEYDLAVTDPNCENSGYTTYTCTICGYSHNADETEALGHDFKDGECTVCGEEDPDLNWFERIIYIIINFFKKLFGII